MNQHQIRIMNHPEPSSEERFARTVGRAHALARRWSEAASASGLEALLSPCDRPALQHLVEQARQRRVVSPDGCSAIAGLAEACARRIAGLADPDAPATRSRALVLHDNSEELHALAAMIDEALDLEAALQAHHRLRAQL